MASGAAERHRQTIKALIIEEFGAERLIFIKDPRICRFVPFISSILSEMNISPVAFLPVRNPLEVAYSLKRREEIALPKSLLLWLRHVLEAEYHSRQMPRCFLLYPGFLIDWRFQMDRAAKKSGVVWPARLERSDIEIEQFLTMDLYHERSTPEDVQNHPNITSLVRTTYDILTAMAAYGENKELLDQLDLVRTKFDDGCDLFGTAAAAEELAVARLAAGRDGLASALNDLTAERNALEAERNALAAERDALAAERDALAHDRDGVVGERNALLASRSWRLTAPLRRMRRLFALEP
jgi:hypothetical protein